MKAAFGTNIDLNVSHPTHKVVTITDPRDNATKEISVPQFMQLNWLSGKSVPNECVVFVRAFLLKEVSAGALLR
jgi:hypothetical protein